MSSSEVMREKVDRLQKQAMVAGAVGIDRRRGYGHDAGTGNSSSAPTCSRMSTGFACRWARWRC